MANQQQKETTIKINEQMLCIQAYNNMQAFEQNHPAILLSLSTTFNWRSSKAYRQTGSYYEKAVGEKCALS